MKKLIIIALAASGAAVAQAQAETAEPRGSRGEFRAEMRALIAGDGMDVAALANLMHERATARFEALDADGDGIVTKDDVLAAAAERAQSRFERMGPNEDGIVKHEGRKGWRKHGERGERRQPLSEEQRAERMQERLQYWFGPLNAQQRQRVLRWAHTLSEQNSRWLRNREQWQAMLLAAVEQRHGADFDKRIARLLQDREALLNEDDRAALQRAEQAGLELVADLHRLADDGQRAQGFRLGHRPVRVGGRRRPRLRFLRLGLLRRPQREHLALEGPDSR